MSSNIVPRLRIPIRRTPRKLKSILTLEGGQPARLEKLRPIITGLLKYERIEGPQAYLDEARGYAEQLIALAIHNGDKDEYTMKMMDYWVKDKRLIPKVFHDFVPRYQTYSSSYTRAFMLPTKLPLGQQYMVLELKGNDLPSVIPRPPVVKNYLTNILLSAARKAHQAEKEMQQERELSAHGSESSLDESKSASQGSENSTQENETVAQENETASPESESDLPESKITSQGSESTSPEKTK